MKKYMNLHLTLIIYFESNFLHNSLIRNKSVFNNIRIIFDKYLQFTISFYKIRGNILSKNVDLISYPFLYEEFGYVDHEVMTDHLSSFLGRIISMKIPLEEETFWMMDRVCIGSYHIYGK